jgi:hypothetical protein
VSFLGVFPDPFRFFVECLNLGAFGFFLTRAGIHTAMKSGMLAGESAFEALTTPNFPAVDQDERPVRFFLNKFIFHLSFTGHVFKVTRNDKKL